MKNTVLISIFLAIISLVGLLFVRQNNKVETKKVVDKATPTESPEKTQERLKPTRTEYKEILTYGVEINEEQYEIFKNNYQTNEVMEGKPSSYFNKGDKWYFINGPWQTQQLYIKHPYVCETWFLWCGSFYWPGGPSSSDDAKRECLTYDIDYGNQNDWMRSNTGQCCHGLINNTTHILSCARTDIDFEERTKGELDYIYNLLREIGADCNNHNCPPALKTKISHY